MYKAVLLKLILMTFMAIYENFKVENEFSLHRHFLKIAFKTWFKKKKTNGIYA